MTNFQGDMHAADALESAAQAVDELRNLKDQLASDTRHSFRTPLTVIDGNARRLVRGGKDLSSSEVEKRVKKIRETVGKMVDIVEQSIQMTELAAHIEAKTKYRKDLAELVSELVDEYRDSAPSVNIQANIDACFGLLTADRRLLEVILDKLLQLGVQVVEPDGELKFVCRREDGSLNISLSTEVEGQFSVESNNALAELFVPADMGARTFNKAQELKVIRLLLEQHGGTLITIIDDQNIAFDVQIPIVAAKNDPGQALVLDLAIDTKDID